MENNFQIHTNSNFKPVQNCVNFCASVVQVTTRRAVCIVRLRQRTLDSAITAVTRLSFVYAIFIMPGEMFKPVTLNPNYFLDSELSGILKYTGKTNEMFTRLMLNIAQLHIKNPPEILNILDPLAGKDTTLYEVLMQGQNANGVVNVFKVG